MERELRVNIHEDFYRILENSVASGRFETMKDAISCAAVRLEELLSDEEADRNDPDLQARLKAAWDESLAEEGEPEDADVFFETLRKEISDRKRSAA